jgi:hypothetical protein
VVPDHDPDDLALLGSGVLTIRQGAARSALSLARRDINDQPDADAVGMEVALRVRSASVLGGLTAATSRAQLVDVGSGGLCRACGSGMVAGERSPYDRLLHARGLRGSLTRLGRGGSGSAACGWHGFAQSTLRLPDRNTKSLSSADAAHHCGDHLHDHRSGRPIQAWRGLIQSWLGEPPRLR